MNRLASASRSSTWPETERAIERADAEQVGTPLVRRMRFRLARRLPAGVYVLAYHAVVGAGVAEWQRAYTRVATSAANFRRGLERLLGSAEPARLDELPTLLADGPPSPARVVVTFDDGYAGLTEEGAGICAALGVQPTVFVNAEFATGRSVYHRVIVALLEREGRAAHAAELLNERLGTDTFSAANFASATKDWPRPEELAQPILEAWGRAAPRAHLSYAELRDLAALGWTIGNHTRSHRPLSFVAPDELDDEILGNERELRDAGLEPLPWLAYPNGRARDVGLAVAEWLERNPRFHGIFGGGGVNVVPTRTEWLRIPVLDEDPAGLELLLRRAAHVTRGVVG